MTTPRDRNANADVGRIIKTLLAHQGKSQTALALYLGMDSASLSRGIKGARKWTFTEVAAIADYFDTSPAIFFDDPESLVRNKCVRLDPDELLIGTEQLLTAAA